MSQWIHAANLLYLASYLVRDILWLRLLTIVAGLVLMPYYYLQPSPVWAAIGWNVVFTGINAAHIWRLWLARRPVVLTEREQRLYQLAFRSLRQREFQKLLALGEWLDAKPAERIVERGKSLDRMMVIYAGEVRVEVDDRFVTALGEGALVGEISFLTGGTPWADVRASSSTTYVAWPTEPLKQFLKHEPELRAAWQMLIGTDLASKLRPGAGGGGDIEARAS